MSDQRQSHLPTTPDDELSFVWAIGIYQGESPLKLGPGSRASNPVLTYLDIHDARAGFVADPFIVRADNRWHMFFEVFDRDKGKGEIGLAVSPNGSEWEYQQIVLDEPYHLSYPHVFEWKGEYYMVPETLQPESVQLYRALPFPTKWVAEATLVRGEFADPSIFRFENRWWLFACSTPSTHDTLRLFFADELTGPWLEHPRSPIVRDNKLLARSAGRVLVFDDRVIRYAQDCYLRYGSKVRACEISELTPTSYHEAECAESPVIEAGATGWNELGMHHVDAHQLSDGSWIACVDGLRAGVGRVAR